MLQSKGVPGTARGTSPAKRLDIFHIFCRAMTLCAALVVAAIITASAVYASPALRVGLLRHYQGISQATLLASADFSVTDLAGRKLASSTNLEPVTFAVGESAIVLKRVDGSATRLADTVVVSSSGSDELIGIDSPGRSFRKYRGNIEISIKGRTLLLVNLVDVEDYLLGVVPAEMPFSFPPEAIKAQAVAARTYAARSVGRASSTGYHLCDTHNSQVYDGQLAEKPACSRAVMDTAGLVLTSDGRPAAAMYCSDCGGATRSYADAYPGRDIPYLRGVKEPPELLHSEWEKTYRLSEIEARLKGAQTSVTRLREVRVNKRDSSGRALVLSLIGDSGEATIGADQFRAAMKMELKSTMFEIQPSADGSVVFKGKGSGHGYGLCQAGAKGLAASPFDYTFQRILAHYYPGTILARL